MHRKSPGSRNPDRGHHGSAVKGEVVELREDRCRLADNLQVRPQPGELTVPNEQVGLGGGAFTSVRGLVADRRGPTTGIARPNARAVNADLHAVAELPVVGAIGVDDALLGIAAAAAFSFIAGTACNEEEDNREYRKDTGSHAHDEDLPSLSDLTLRYWHTIWRIGRLIRNSMTEAALPMSLVY